ncbi:MAG: cytochrome c oxidase subunit 3 [Bacteroides sp.]|nr:MAG: cytochrome c oxidase subunit 3 [Bacteroides sp.]
MNDIHLNKINHQNWKLMMWLFLISDIFTFCGFINVFFALRLNSKTIWPNGDIVFTYVPLIGYNIPLAFVTIMTFILIMSSISMYASTYEYKKSKKINSLIWLFFTILIGIMFIFCQSLEWIHLSNKGYWFGKIPIGHNVNYSNIFFAITGFHGIHVLIGIMINIFIFIKIYLEKRMHSYNFLNNAGLYWHFVDLIWVFIFTFIYLI